MSEEIGNGAGHPGAVVPCAEDDAVQPSEDDRTGTHGTGLECHVERAADESRGAERARRVPDDEHLRMGDGVLIAEVAIAGAADDRVVADDDRPDGDILSRSGRAGFLQRRRHPQAILWRPDHEGGVSLK